ncbi:hypothetical protein BC938DRAFT_471147, partial [Jimgerdemannia flammicorona]
GGTKEVYQNKRLSAGQLPASTKPPRVVALDLLRLFGGMAKDMEITTFDRPVFIRFQDVLDNYALRFRTKAPLFRPTHLAVYRKDRYDWDRDRDRHDNCPRYDDGRRDVDVIKEIPTGRSTTRGGGESRIMTGTMTVIDTEIGDRDTDSRMEWISDMTMKKVPVSLEELIAKEEAEKREAEKPKFFTKEERAKLALEKRQQEVEELWRKQEQERHVRDENRNDREQHFECDFGRERDHRREPPKTPAAMELDDDKEVQVIRERHMDGERRKRKIRKMNEKVVFDWATDEDTSYDFNPLYANQHDARMFGRRHFAGMNIKDQIKQRSAFYNRMLEEPRTDRAEELMDIDRKD